MDTLKAWSPESIERLIWAMRLPGSKRMTSKTRDGTAAKNLTWAVATCIGIGKEYILIFVVRCDNIIQRSNAREVGIDKKPCFESENLECSILFSPYERKSPRRVSWTSVLGISQLSMRIGCIRQWVYPDFGQLNIVQDLSQVSGQTL